MVFRDPYLARAEANWSSLFVNFWMISAGGNDGGAGASGSFPMRLTSCSSEGGGVSGAFDCADACSALISRAAVDQTTILPKWQPRPTTMRFMNIWIDRKGTRLNSS